MLEHRELKPLNLLVNLSGLLMLLLVASAPRHRGRRPNEMMAVCVRLQQGLLQIYLHIALTQRDDAGMMSAAEDLAFYVHVLLRLCLFFPTC